MQSKARHTGSHIAEVIIVLAILVVANYLGYKFFYRLDVTENKMYTISQATKNVLAGLDDPVNIEVFLSKDLPPQMVAVVDEVRDKLAEFTAYSGGRFKVRYIDPGDDEEKKEYAMNQGVRELDVQVVERDQASVRKVFFGLAMNYLDKSESIPVLIEPNTGSTAALEYELTSRLVRLTLDEKPRIGFFAGTFTTSQQQQPPQYTELRNLLAGPGGMYEVVQIDGQKDKELPEDLDGLVVCGAFGMSDSLKYSVDQFLLSGGQMIVALDPMMEVSQQGQPQQAYPSLPTIEEQLEKYGVKFKKQLVIDEKCALASFRTGFGYVTMGYRLWPDVGSLGFSRDIAAVSKLETLVLPWCCPLSAVDGAGSTFRPLAMSSERSYTMSSPFDLNPQQDWAFLATSSEDNGPYILACLVEGTIPTAFPDGPPAAEESAGGEEDRADDLEAAMDAPLFDPADQIKGSDGSGRMVVLSTAIGLSDSFLGQFPQNALFAVNTVDMLLLGDELLSIRSTPVTTRPLRLLSDAQRSFYRWMNVLGVPVLLALFGLLLWFLKGRRRLAIQRRYAP